MVENDNHIGRISLAVIIMSILALAIRMTVLRTDESLNRKKYSDPIVSSALVRGTIYDRNGNMLAFQAPDYGFLVNLKQSSTSYIASIISPYVSIDILELDNLLQKGIRFFPLSFIPTKEESDSIARMISDFSLEDEISLKLKEQRKYPSGTNILKYIGEVDEYLNGISGIEKLYNDSLKAVPKLGYSVVKGSSIVLTLDMDLEFVLERLPNLKEYQESTVAILSDKNEILAYHGKADEDVLNAMVYSITNNDSTTIVNNPNHFAEKELINIGNYRIYIDATSDKIKESIEDGIRKSLLSLGLVSASSF